ncbi:MAG: flagellar basal body rod protein FlgB [Planctomycetes bacterium]|nr:flagellar basal body rod protein FlgB [Planctomycetota bacterium]
MNDFDKSFAVTHKVLDWTTARARALTTNIAHASEPGYKRVDVSFGDLLEAVRAERERGQQGALARAKPEAVVDLSAAPSSNGNTVDFEREQVQIDKNSLLHDLATYFASSKLNSLRSAIRGSAS